MILERKVKLYSLIEVKDFIEMAGKYRCDIKVKARDKIVDGKSMMGIVSLIPSQPLTIVAKGEDAGAFIGHLDQTITQTQQ